MSELSLYFVFWLNKRNDVDDASSLRLFFIIILYNYSFDVIAALCHALKKLIWCFPRHLHLAISERLIRRISIWFTISNFSDKQSMHFLYSGVYAFAFPIPFDMIGTPFSLLLYSPNSVNKAVVFCPVQG